jgi:hypothetical protein
MRQEYFTSVILSVFMYKISFKGILRQKLWKIIVFEDEYRCLNSKTGDLTMKKLLCFLS